MKKLIVLIIAGLLVFTVLSACKKAKEEVDNIGDTLVIQPQDRANLLKLNVDIETIRRSIEVFHAAQGYYPASLDELAQKGVLGRIPREPFGGEWNYDPSNGSVKSSSHPDL